MQTVNYFFLLVRCEIKIIDWNKRKIKINNHQEREMNDKQVSNLFISSIGFFYIFLHPAKTEENRIKPTI